MKIELQQACPKTHRFCGTAKKSGFFGRGGNLEIRIESTTTVDNQKTKLRSAKGKAGDDKTGATVVLVVLFGP